MGLFQLFILAHLAAFERGCIHLEQGFGGHVAKQFLGQLHDFIVIHRACCRKDHLFRTIMILDETLQIRAAEIRYPFRRPKDGAPERLPRIGLFLQPVKDHIIRRIQRLTDLLEDHAALHLDLIWVQHRIAQDIGNHIQPQRHIVFQHPHIIGGHLTAGIGIDIAAHIFNRFGDLQ